MTPPSNGEKKLLLTQNKFLIWLVSLFVSIAGVTLVWTVNQVNGIPKEYVSKIEYMNDKAELNKILLRIESKLDAHMISTGAKRYGD